MTNKTKCNQINNHTKMKTSEFPHFFECSVTIGIYDIYIKSKGGDNSEKLLCIGYGMESI